MAMSEKQLKAAIKPLVDCLAAADEANERLVALAKAEGFGDVTHEATGRTYRLITRKEVAEGATSKSGKPKRAQAESARYVRLAPSPGRTPAKRKITA